jgi:hypothetical protein
MLQEIDPDSLLFEELKAESSFETKLFANAAKGEYDHKLTDYKSGSEFPQVFDSRYRITKTELEELVAQLVMDKEAAEEGDVDTLGDEELEECHVEEFSTAAISGVLTEATEATNAAQPQR